MNPNDMSNPNSILYQSVIQSAIYSGTSQTYDPAMSNSDSSNGFDDDFIGSLLIGLVIVFIFLLIFRWLISAINKVNL